MELCRVTAELCIGSANDSRIGYDRDEPKTSQAFLAVKIDGNWLVCGDH